MLENLLSASVAAVDVLLAIGESVSSPTPPPADSETESPSESQPDEIPSSDGAHSRHPKTDRHKRRLAFDELLGLKTAAILASAVEPQPFDLPLSPPVDEQAAADWHKAREHVAESTTANRQRQLAFNGSPKLNRRTMDLIRDGAATGDRHRLVFSAAANLAEFGCPPALAHALLTESALDSGLAPNDVRRQIECGLSSIHSEPTHQDGCVSPQASRNVQQSRMQDTCQQMTGATE